MLTKNTVFSDKEKSQSFRLIYANPSTDEAAVFPLEERNALPLRISFSALVSKHKLGIIKIERGTGLASSPQPSSENSALRAEKAWLRIKPLVSQPAVLWTESRYPLIKAHADLVGCSLNTLLKDLRRYWAGGMTPAALAGNFSNCGHKVNENGAPAGRKPTLVIYEIYNVRAEDKKNMSKIIKRIYLAKNSLITSNVTHAYQKLVEDFYSFNDGNGNRTINEVGERPTLKQFRHFLNTNFSLETRIRGKKGDTDYERNHAPKLGSTQQDCLGVGHIYEIDATIADVFLVAEGARNLIIGKPTLYLIIDRRSRLIVGFYVGLEYPSWPAAMQSIISIAEDKQTLCERHGLEYREEDWPADGIFPQEFLADRGEMLSINSGNIVDGLHINVANLPAQRPDYKAFVECGFMLVHHEMKASVPGYEPPENVFARQGKHYEKDASLTLKEFTKIVLGIIIARNRMPMPDFKLSLEALSKNARPIPREIWAEEATSRMGQLKRFDERHVRFSLLPKDEATVMDNGILFKGCLYTSKIALGEQWFVHARRGRNAVQISYDPRLVNEIYIHDEKNRSKWHSAKLLESSEEYRGLSFDEVKVAEHLRKKKQPENEQTKLQVRSDLHRAIDPVGANAKREMKEQSKGKSRTARKASIAEDRIIERRAMRQTEASMPSEGSANSESGEVLPFMPPAGNKYAVDESALESKPSSISEKLKAKQKEMHAD